MIVLMCCLLCALGIFVSRAKPDQETDPINQNNENPNYTEEGGAPQAQEADQGKTENPA